MFRRRDFLHLWCTVPCGDLLFRQKKKAKLIQEVSWKSLALVRFYLWDTGELTFFTLFAVCIFKGTRAVRSETSLRHCLFLCLTYFLFRWYFLLNHNLHLVCGGSSGFHPDPWTFLCKFQLWHSSEINYSSDETPNRRQAEAGQDESLPASRRWKHKFAL